MSFVSPTLDNLRRQRGEVVAVAQIPAARVQACVTVRHTNSIAPQRQLATSGLPRACLSRHPPVTTFAFEPAGEQGLPRWLISLNSNKRLSVPRRKAWRTHATESQMPKMKTKSGAKKRFRLTGTGKVIAGQAGKRHGMIKRTNSQIRNQRGTTILAECDGRIIRKSFLPNG
ncbi:UNVERIFIED_ORG: ribosomal protein L35 [Xanthobacter viscosus]